MPPPTAPHHRPLSTTDRFSTTDRSPPQHFDLVDERELSPLQELIEQFTAGRGGGPAVGGCRAGAGPEVGMLG